MNPARFIASQDSLAAFTRTNYRGGQELLLHEIAACMEPGWVVWLPFLSSGTLARHLRGMGHPVRVGLEMNLTGVDVMYFGTPTIVNDGPLFPEDAGGIAWTKSLERSRVRGLVKRAADAGVRMIISGLGSGDISPEERCADMGPGAVVVAIKHFDDFTDWVFRRNL